MDRLTEAIECFKNRETESAEAVNSAVDILVGEYRMVVRKRCHRMMMFIANLILIFIIWMLAPLLVGEAYLNSHLWLLILGNGLMLISLIACGMATEPSKREQMIGENLIDMDDVRLLPCILDAGTAGGRTTYFEQLKQGQIIYLNKIQACEAHLLTKRHRSVLRWRVKGASRGIYYVSKTNTYLEDRLIATIGALARIGDVESCKDIERYLSKRNRVVLSVHMRIDPSIQFLTTSSRIRTVAEEARRQLVEVENPSDVLLRGSSLPEAPNVLLRPAMDHKESKHDQQQVLLRSVEEPLE